MPILTPEERVGTLLADKYQIKEIIGKGGMGVVFGAEHTWTGRDVAVKVIHPSLSEDTSLAQRLLREARTAAKLNHPNAVQVLDMGEDTDGTVYLVLERLEGEPLGEYLWDKGTIGFDEALSLLLPVMSALAGAHEKGLVHRDLKPDNIFLHQGANGLVPTLLDFGIAKVLQEEGARVTRTGMMVGTPQYVSPEQAHGDDEVGPATDVWAMGVVFFEALTGEMPFEGDSPTQVIVKVCTTDAPRLVDRGVEPRVLAAAVDRALRADLSERYANMREFADALVDAAGEAGLMAVGTLASGEHRAPTGAFSTSNPLLPADGSAPLLTSSASRPLPPVTGEAPAAKPAPSHPPPERPSEEAPATPMSKAPLLMALAGAAALALLVGGIAAAVMLPGSDEPTPTASAPPAEDPEPPPTAEAPNDREPASTLPSAVAHTPEPAPAPEPEPEPTPEPEAAPEPEPAAETAPRPAPRRRRARRRRPEISADW